jgi:hypothetical protein
MELIRLHSTHAVTKVYELMYIVLAISCLNISTRAHHYLQMDQRLTRKRVLNGKVYIHILC